MPGKKRNIVFIWPYVEWGGAQIHLLGIMKRARPAWDVSVVLPSGSDEKFLQFLRDLDIPYKTIESRLDLRPAHTLARKIERHITRIRCEIQMIRAIRGSDIHNTVFHVDIAPWQSWQFFTILSAIGARTFVTLHNAPQNGSVLRTAIWKLRMRFVTKLRRFNILAANGDTRSRLRDLVGESVSSRMPITYTSIDPDEIDTACSDPSVRDRLRQRFGIETDEFVVLCVGQFIDRKGRWVFLDAARDVAKTAKNVRFVWLAPNVLSEAEIKEIDDRDPHSKFKYIRSDDLGIDRQSILSIYAIADCFALPSYVEGLPIALLEAMASGLPAISTNINSIPEAVIDGETGLLIEPGDSTTLSDSVKRLLTDTNLRKRLGDAGRTHVLKTFNEAAMAATALAAFERSFADAD